MSNPVDWGADLPAEKLDQIAERIALSEILKTLIGEIGLQLHNTPEDRQRWYFILLEYIDERITTGTAIGLSHRDGKLVQQAATERARHLVGGLRFSP